MPDKGDRGHVLKEIRQFHAQDVPAGHLSHQPVLAVHHRQDVHLVQVHQPRGLLDIHVQCGLDQDRTHHLFSHHLTGQFDLGQQKLLNIRPVVLSSQPDLLRQSRVQKEMAERGHGL